MARLPLNFEHTEATLHGFANTTTFTNGKGGVGKTSCTANIGGLLADAGYRVLLVDFDPQSNLNRDLGYDRDTGEELFDALRTGAQLPVTEGIRPNLDVVKGGTEMFAVQAVIESRGSTVAQALSVSLAPLVTSYDYILFDTPPGEQALINAALFVSRAVIIPTTPDEAGVDGVVLAAERFAQARQKNPNLRLAGVVLFNVGSRSRRIERLIRADLEELLDSAAPVFARRIRHLEGAAIDTRRKGVLVHEIEPLVAQAHRERFKQLREGNQAALKASVHSSDVSGLAEDYAVLAEEILARLIELEETR